MLKKILAICLPAMLAASASATEIAVLLPTSGPNAKAALALRDGLLAAYYQALPEEKASTSLRFYDTPADRPLPPLLAALPAQDTRLVIGPLLREQVAAVVAAPPDVPVLALNRTATSAHGVWQLALSPEDEITPLADLIRGDGVSRLVILMGPDEASDRIRHAFEMAWEARGGATPLIRTLQESKDGGISAGFRQLLSEPGMSGVQAFLVATPGLASQIQTLLPYYRRTPAAVYTLSTAFDEEAPLIQRRDFNGIRFCGLPWNLSRRWTENLVLHAVAAPESGGFNRLMAMGADAWELSAMIPPLKPRQLEGRTGRLTLDSEHLTRIPACSEIQEGKPVELTPRNRPGR